MERELEVHIDWEGETAPVGRLWARSKGARETATFEYDPSWLARPGGFALDPNLVLRSGQFHTAGGLFNAFTDPAHEEGQKLMRFRAAFQHVGAELLVLQ